MEDRARLPKGCHSTEEKHLGPRGKCPNGGGKYNHMTGPPVLLSTTYFLFEREAEGKERRAKGLRREIQGSI